MQPISLSGKIGAGSANHGFGFRAEFRKIGPEFNATDYIYAEYYYFREIENQEILD